MHWKINSVGFILKQLIITNKVTHWHFVVERLSTPIIYIYNFSCSTKSVHLHSWCAFIKVNDNQTTAFFCSNFVFISFFFYTTSLSLLTFSDFSVLRAVCRINSFEPAHCTARARSAQGPRSAQGSPAQWIWRCFLLQLCQRQITKGG